MNDEKQETQEFAVKEYPNATRLLEGKKVIGVGNLILTNERLVFLYRVPLDEQEVEYIQKLSEKATTARLLDVALTLDKRNFQIPLSSVIGAKTGLYSLLPFPRPRLRVYYRSERKKKQVKELSFMFTIPIWRGWFQLEITTVKYWEKIINSRVARSQLAMKEAKSKKE